MAKEKQEKELETSIKADASFDVEVEKKEKNMVPESTQNLSASNLIKEFESEQLKKELPEIYVGDTVKVGVRITEGNKERVQPYEGVVIAKRHGGINQTITVRRIFQGIGVERVFMLHSPQVEDLTPSYEKLIYILLIKRVVEDLKPRHQVLETCVLPTELTTHLNDYTRLCDQ